jgi:hypothetical protein
VLQIEHLDKFGRHNGLEVLGIGVLMAEIAEYVAVSYRRRSDATRFVSSPMIVPRAGSPDSITDTPRAAPIRVYSASPA